MEIVRRYECYGLDGTAIYYAQVRLDDGSVVELKSHDRDADFLAIAAALAVPGPAPIWEVEAEDGTII